MTDSWRDARPAECRRREPPQRAETRSTLGTLRNVRQGRWRGRNCSAFWPMSAPDACAVSACCAGEKDIEPRRRRWSRRPPDIPMVQAADPGQRDHLPELPRLDRARDRRVAVEAHVRAVLVVVAGVPADQVQDMTLTEHDHVIEQVSTKGANPPFRVPDR